MQRSRTTTTLSDKTSRTATAPIPILAAHRGLTSPKAIKKANPTATLPMRTPPEAPQTATIRRCCTVVTPPQQLLNLLSSSSDLAQIERDVHRAQLSATRQGSSSNLRCIAGILAGYGYNVKLRSALGSKTRTDYLRTLKHTFIVITTDIDGCSATEVLVDFNFNENFEVAKPTQRYAKLLEHVPGVLVASTDTLKDVLQMLCSEMRQCFECQGQYIPPWREYASLLSKWFPVRCHDMSVLEDICSASESEDDENAYLSPTSVLPAAHAASSEHIKEKARMLPQQFDNVLQCSRITNRMHSLGL